jgi:hypothetical protein
MANREYLAELRGDPRFSALMKEAQQACPEVPPFDPSNDNTDEWKHVSGIKQGFDLVMSFFLKGN